MKKLIYSALLSLSYGSPSQPPNIIVLLADDLGWDDVSWHNPAMVTPHLQQLASMGATLNTSYFHPKCSPSRAALLTGYYPHRLGLQRSGVGRYHAYGLHPRHALLPEQLRAAGYSSHLVGKWHLGYCRPELLPNHRGFDSFFGLWTHVADYYSRVTPVSEGDKPRHKKRHRQNKRDESRELRRGYDLHYNDDITHEYEGLFSTEMFAQQAVKTIKARDPSQPLFLMVSFQAPHNPFNRPPQRYYQHYEHAAMSEEMKVRAATVTALDAAVGEIVAAVRAEGMLDNTLILFSSDNGGAGNRFNKPLRGRKDTLYEGGVRVVGLVAAPGLGLARGTLYPGLVHVTDWFSTFLSLAGLPVPGDVDGMNVFPSLRDGTESPRRQIVHNVDEDRDKGAWQGVARMGDFKLIWGQAKLLNKHRDGRTGLRRGLKDQYALYNIKRDPYERHPLNIEEHRDTVRSLKRLILSEYERTTFPEYHDNVEAAYPGNNGGNVVTGWC